MSRTYRRYTKKSQKRTVNFMKSIFHEFNEEDFNDNLYIVKYKGLNKFFTDNQKVPNWKICYHHMNKKSRYEAKKVLKNIPSIDFSENLIFKYHKGKHSFSKNIFIYFY